MSKKTNGPSAPQLSDHCVIDHFDRTVDDPPWRSPPPGWLLRLPFLLPLLFVDRKMHFTGFRGGIWRLLGVDRSYKNPNMCNV